MPRDPLPPQDPFAGSYRQPERPRDVVAMGYPGPRRSMNGLGIAGFIVSVVGVFTLGCLSPVGVLLSLIAAFRRPRGFAIAGVVIGGFGVLLLAGMVALVVSMGVFMGAAFSDGLKVSDEIKAYQSSHAGALPQSWADLPAMPPGGLLDEWGRAYEFAVVTGGRQSTGQRIQLTSGGPDGRQGTPDDVHILIEDQVVVAYVGRTPFWMQR